ncbi:MAG TPA: hypothetical protein PLX33_10460 [Alphaproteobacteria bacterium]|nr:hypothetical protein [Alphaproteobacteria bacterium]
MTDHKTVREALEYASELVTKHTDHRASVLRNVGYKIVEALTTLDRIEAVETVTDDEASSYMVQSLRDYKLHQGQFGDTAAQIIIKHIRANGLRIVKEKQ